MGRRDRPGWEIPNRTHSDRGVGIHILARTLRFDQNQRLAHRQNQAEGLPLVTRPHLPSPPRLRQIELEV